MLVQTKLPERIWSKIEEITPKYSYSKMNVEILDESITIIETGYLTMPLHDEFGNLIQEKVDVTTTTHKVLLDDIRKNKLDDNSHFALDYDGNLYPIITSAYNKTKNYLRLSIDICNRCMAYIFLPTSECTFKDALIAIPTSENTEITANCEVLSDTFGKVIDGKKIKKGSFIGDLKEKMYPIMKVTYPDTVKAGEIAYFTVILEPTEHSVDSSFNVFVRAFSGIAVKSIITCSDISEVKVPVLTTGLEPGDKVVVGFKYTNDARDHNRFDYLHKISVV